MIETGIRENWRREIGVSSINNYFGGILMQKKKKKNGAAIKMNKIVPFIATWMQLGSLLLSEVNQKDKHHKISCICGI